MGKIAAATRAVRSGRCWWPAPEVEMVGRVVWDARLAAARVALRARVRRERALAYTRQAIVWGWRRGVDSVAIVGACVEGNGYSASRHDFIATCSAFDHLGGRVRCEAGALGYGQSTRF